MNGFKDNWEKCKEAQYNHWTSGNPKNQIQLAFRMHWQLFEEIIGKKKGGKCLEVGCGRGTISSYFAQANYDCTLLDYSQIVLNIAKEIFKNNGHVAKFICDDANKLPFSDDSFDVVVSIGLLEHFKNIELPLKEQVRVLKPGGCFLGYVVPENPENIQRYFRWINKCLKLILKLILSPQNIHAKSDVYRSNLGSDRYLDILKNENVEDIRVMGVYPLPMISNSPEFPFTLLPSFFENILTKIFEAALFFRKIIYKKNPWICSESLGQAFLIIFKKRSAP